MVKVVEFDHFKKEAGLPTFTMSVSNWIDKTSAIGIVAKTGRYGGIYAHRDIAFEFEGFRNAALQMKIAVPYVFCMNIVV